ncbi:MAG: hypothetical protein II921_08650 [Treponema sp.]|nr:hypothetical protein [Treponema sp.]
MLYTELSTAKLNALAPEDETFYKRKAYYSLQTCIARLRSISSEKVDFSANQALHANDEVWTTFFSFDPYIAKLRSIFSEYEFAARRNFIRENRSPKNNTQKDRDDIFIKKDRCFTQPAENGLESWILKRGTKITKVKSIARGNGIDRVQEKINKLLNDKGIQTHACDWEKMKGRIVAYRDGQAYFVNIHFYRCKSIGYFDFKVKHIFKKL